MTLRAPATVIGRYEVQATIGQGGVSTVYRAFDPATDRIVALKVLQPEHAGSAPLRSLFEQEALLLCAVDHPHIVACLDTGEQDRVRYFAMEYLEGSTLFDAIRARRRAGRAFAPAEALEILRPLARALDHMHGRGIVHRDLKPENIVLAPRGPVLADLGLAAPAGTPATTAPRMGTLEYMAPEQILDEPADPRTDVYALGILLYELLTTLTPFERPTDAEVAQAQLYEAPPTLAELNPVLHPSPELEEVAYRALAKDPPDRFASAQEFVDALATVLTEEPRGILTRWLRPRVRARTA